MADYIQDPDNPNKQIPAPRGHALFMDQPSTSHIPVFATEALAKVAKPAIGTMTYEIANSKIWIYDGATWQSFTKDP